MTIKHPNICIVPKKELVCVLQFLGKSLEIKNRLQNATERTLPYYKLVKVIFKSPSQIVNHFHFKDVLPKKLCTGIFYIFSVIAATPFITAKTKRHFYVRAAEHTGISHLINKRLKNVKQSTISDHLLTCDCNTNFNDFTILSKDSNNINLLIKKNLLISRNKLISNEREIVFPNYLTYTRILV